MNENQQCAHEEWWWVMCGGIFWPIDHSPNTYTFICVNSGMEAHSCGGELMLFKLFSWKIKFIHLICIWIIWMPSSKTILTIRIFFFCWFIDMDGINDSPTKCYFLPFVAGKGTLLSLILYLPLVFLEWHLSHSHLSLSLFYSCCILSLSCQRLVIDQLISTIVTI